MVGAAGRRAVIGARRHALRSEGHYTLDDESLELSAVRNVRRREIEILLGHALHLGRQVRG